VTLTDAERAAALRVKEALAGLTCPRCRGDGKDWDPQATAERGECLVCAGTGRIPRLEHASGVDLDRLATLFGSWRMRTRGRAARLETDEEPEETARYTAPK